jgi:ribosomal protein S18 acetylase RimI-like enzyme
MQPASSGPLKERNSLRMKDAALKIHRVSTVMDPAFEELVRIYSEAHPASERKSLASLSAMVERPEYLFLTMAQDRQVAGFAIVLCFQDSDACLLEYFAISRNRRGLGIGRSLFGEFVKLREISDRYLLLEVDSDTMPTAENDENARRKNFYRRLGCREIENVRYLMPPISTAIPPAMNLLVYRRELPRSVEQIRLRKWLEQCYVEVYGMAANDFRIEAMLKGLPADLRLV